MFKPLAAATAALVFAGTAEAASFNQSFTFNERVEVGAPFERSIDLTPFLGPRGALTALDIVVTLADDVDDIEPIGVESGPYVFLEQRFRLIRTGTFSSTTDVYGVFQRERTEVFGDAREIAVLRTDGAARSLQTETVSEGTPVSQGVVTDFQRFGTGNNLLSENESLQLTRTDVTRFGGQISLSLDELALETAQREGALAFSVTSSQGDFIFEEATISGETVRSVPLPAGAGLIAAALAALGFIGFRRRAGA